MVLPWAELSLFILAVLLVALYGLTASGHFPAQSRAEEFKSGQGAALICGTMIAACSAGAVVLIFASAVLPWHAVVIGGGAMLLIAPLLLQLFPDSFVDGPKGLLTFAGGTILVAVVMWAMA